MRKIMFIILLLAAFWPMCQNASAKVKIIGNYRFEYSNYKDGVRIHTITPLSEKHIKTLKIPGKLGGKKVIKLSGVDDGYYTGKDIFGLHKVEEYTGVFPERTYERVKKIRRIIIPQCVRNVSGNCFIYLYPKNRVAINIPRCASENAVENIWNTWKKITISPKNKTHTIIDGCLIRKKDNCVRQFVDGKKSIKIPSGIKEIAIFSDVIGVNKISIPASVKRIYEFALNSNNKIKFKVSKKNRFYKVVNGNIISKRTKRLVIGIYKNGILKIPRGVKTIGTNGMVGKKKRLVKIIIPKELKIIKHSAGLHGNYEIIKDIVFECQGKKPPKLTDPVDLFYYRSLTIYVPKGSLEKYKKSWSQLSEGYESLSFKEN